MAYSRLKMGAFHLLGHPECSGLFFGETHFSPVLNLFLPIKAQSGPLGGMAWASGSSNRTSKQSMKASPGRP